MIKYLKHILSLLCFSIGFSTIAQSDVKLSNFIFTPLVHNPAYAGSSAGYSVTGFYTSQWVGFEGAPETLIFTGHKKIGATNLGAGFDVISDKIGASKQNRVAGNIAYHFNLTENWMISTGLKIGINMYSIDYSLLSIKDPSELSNSAGNLSETNFIFGTGLYLHKENFFIGLSVPNFFTEDYIDGFQNTVANTTPNYFFSAGYRFELERNIYLQPTVLTRLANGAPYSALVSFNLDWEDKFFANLNYEHNVTAGAFVGFRITDRIMVGYAYDTSVKAFNQYNDGIHSFMLNFRSGERSRNNRCGCYTY